MRKTEVRITIVHDEKGSDLIHKLNKLAFDNQWDAKLLAADNVSVKPAGARLIVKPIDADTKTAGGLIIPDVAQERPSRGIIVSIGKDFDRSGDGLNVGDMIIFGKFQGTEIDIDGIKHLVLREEEVIASIDIEQNPE